MFKSNKSLQFVSGILIFFLFSCSTEKNTPMRRAFHNVTSKFNVYFNGNEAYKEGVKKAKKVPENFSILLPIFPFERKEAATAAATDMDAVIKKSVKLIKFHSITTKPERKNKNKPLTKEEKEFYAKIEYNNWVDDAYLLIGKANVYKQEYRLALKSLFLIINKYKKEQTRFDAMLWSAITYIELGDYKDAKTYLELIKPEKDYNGRLDREIDLTYASIFIHQKDYEKGAEMLRLAIDKTKKKKEKARLKYLLAQLNQKMGDEDQAASLYSQVIKANPNYDMTFSAKINLARSSGATDTEALRKTLKKMLKDDKNIDYYDQIYFALAEIDMKNGNEPEAVENYLLSAEKSTTNVDQKALSFLALADIYFARPQYVPASAYYDSTMSVLSNKHPDYKEIARKAKNLGHLITNLEIVANQDSLQKVAKLSESDRKQLINNIIENIKRQEQAKKNAENAIFRPSEDAMAVKQKGNWYFYNPAALSLGRTEFLKKWGRRKLSDNWRRKNKAVIIIETTETNESTDSTRITDNKKPAFYLQDVPLTDSLMVLSNQKIAKALYEGAGVYEKKMKDYPEAEKLYITLTKRFPESRYTLEAYFHLYLINFKELKNKSEAEKYRKIILNKFPNSKYAEILTDPNYLKKLEETQNTINLLYAQAYSAYKTKNYNKTILKTEKAFKISPKNDLRPKFLFLKALAYGELGQKETMKIFLTEIITKYKTSEIYTQASDILRVMKSGKFDDNLFQFQENGNYYYEIVLANDKTKVRNLKFALTNYGIKKFPAKTFKIEEVALGAKNIQLLVKILTGKKEAMQFFNGLKTENTLKDVPANEYIEFVITEENFKKMQILKETSKYLNFFKTNY